jgi:hypothetical protein
MQIAALVLAWEEEAINPMIDSPPLRAEKKPPALASCKRKPTVWDCPEEYDDDKEALARSADRCG